MPLIHDPEKAFTTFEAAKICGVYHTSVINWANKGKLKVYLTPGGHRRIKLSDLLDFMRKFDFQIPEGLEKRSKSVLIVEDDSASRRLIQRTLEGLSGVDVSTCADGLEALVAIGKDQPDLVILDIRIPQVNGIEVCKVLKSGEQTRPIRIAAVSGEALAGEEKAAIKEYADCFLQKPFTPAALKAQVRKLLDLEG